MSIYYMHSDLTAHFYFGKDSWAVKCTKIYSLVRMSLQTSAWFYCWKYCKSWIDHEHLLHGWTAHFSFGKEDSWAVKCIQIYSLMKKSLQTSAWFVLDFILILLLMSSLADFRGWEVERDWEREGEARGCEIVCMCVGVHVCTCVDAGGGGGMEWDM